MCYNSMWVSLLIILCSAGAGETQCNDTRLIQTNNGTIQSPHFMHEYGNTSDCAWKFEMQEQQMLILNVTWQRLYYVKEVTKNHNEVYCPRRHNLTINNEEVNCTRRVKLEGNGSTPTYCKAFFESKNCGESSYRGCESYNRTSSPVHVKYTSSGEKDGSNKGPVWGFKMKYKYIKCVQDTTTLEQRSTSTIIQDTTKPQKGGLSTSLANAAGSSVTNTMTDDNTITIVLAIAGSLLFLLIVVSVIVLCKRKNAKRINQGDQAGVSSLYIAAEDPGSGHVTINSQSESAMYSAIEKKGSGAKGTTHYEKTMKDNALYEATTQQAGEMVENILYGER